MVKLTRQQSKMSRIHSNNKIAIVAQGGDDGDGHSGLSQQPTMKLMTLNNTMVLKRSVQQVSSLLIVVFSLFFAIFLKWPHNGHVENGYGDFEPNIQRIRLVILDE